MSISTKTFFVWLPALIWLVIVTGLSTMPSITLPHFDLFAPDKLAHAFIYAVLMGLSWRSLRRLTGRTPTLREEFLLFLFAAGYGALMECVQGAFLPGRSFEYDDMLANAFGAAIAWILCHFWFRRFKKVISL